MDSVTANIKQVLDVLQLISAEELDTCHFFYKTSINEVLSVGPLHRTQIPLIVIEMLISAGFSVNIYNFNYKPCLDIAVENHHYNAIKILVKHGAKNYCDCSDEVYYSETHFPLNRNLNPPIVSLVRHPDARLDVFDVLATPQSLHDCSHCKYLPLHEAASHGRTDLFQHLIKLGASVDQLDGFLKLPVMHLLERNTGQFNDKLFRVLLPKRARGKSILASIYRILRMEENPKGTMMHMSDILHQLLQRLCFNKALNVVILQVASGNPAYFALSGFPLG